MAKWQVFGWGWLAGLMCTLLAADIAGSAAHHYFISKPADISMDIIALLAFIGQTANTRTS